MESRALLRRLFRLLFAGFDRMTMVRHESSSVLLHGRNRWDLPKVTDEDYSDRARLSTLPAFMRAERESRQVVMGTVLAISQIKATSSRATAMMAICADLPRIVRRR